MWKAALGFALAASAAVALAQPPAASVTLKTGETALVRIAPDGAVSVESRGPAPAMSGFEAESLRQMAGTAVPEGSGPLPPVAITGRKAPPVAAGRVRLTLREVAGKTPHDAMLSIENGYDRGFRYRAVMRRGTRSAPTDVCMVLPGKPGFEHWPFQIDAVDLADLRLVAWKPGDALPCE
jgi:hypothetical protein